MQLEKNRTNILEWDFFDYKDFASQGLKGQDGSRENYVTQVWRQQWKMKEKWLWRHTRPPLICPSLPSGGHESAVDVQSYILSHITILRFIQTIWFLDCLILQSYDSCEQFDFCGVFCYNSIDYFQQFDFLYNNLKDSYGEFDFCNVSCYNPIIHTKKALPKAQRTQGLSSPCQSNFLRNLD